jgi:hypothetical protein
MQQLCRYLFVYIATAPIFVVQLLLQQLPCCTGWTQLDRRVQTTGLLAWSGCHGRKLCGRHMQLHVFLCMLRCRQHPLALQSHN